MAEKSEHAVSWPRWPIGWLFLAFVLILAGVLRFTGLTEREIWIDESCTSYVVDHWADWPDDGPDQETDVAHRPYYWALSLWTRIVGDDAYGLRSFSALGGCFVVLGIGLLGGSLAGTRIALLSMTLAATNPLLIHYSQQARVYVWWILLSTLWLMCLQRAARSLQWRWWLASVAAAGACVFVHYHTLFFLPAGIWCVFISRHRIRALRQWFISYVLLALAMIPVVIHYVLPLRHQGPQQWLEQTWLASPPSLAMLKSLGVMLPTANYPDYLGTLGAAIDMVQQEWGAIFTYSILLLPVVFLLAGLVCIVFIQRPEKQRTAGEAGENRVTIHTVAWLGGFVMTGLAIMAGYAAIVSPAYIVGRYDVIAIPAVIVLSALCINSLAMRYATTVQASRWLVTIFMVLIVACSSSMVAAQRMIKHGDSTHRRAQMIAATVGDEDLIVSLSMYKWFMDYEWRQMDFVPNIISFPTVHDRQLCWDDADTELADPISLREDVAIVMARIDRTISQGRRVWLLAQGEPTGLRWDVNRQLIEALHQSRINIVLQDEWVGIAELRKR